MRNALIFRYLHNYLKLITSRVVQVLRRIYPTISIVHTETHIILMHLFGKIALGDTLCPNTL